MWNTLSTRWYNGNPNFTLTLSRWLNSKTPISSKYPQKMNHHFSARSFAFDLGNIHQSFPHGQSWIPSSWVRCSSRLSWGKTHVDNKGVLLCGHGAKDINTYCTCMHTYIQINTGYMHMYMLINQFIYQYPSIYWSLYAHLNYLWIQYIPCPWSISSLVIGMWNPES